jgi:hypothetical protein
MTLLTRVAERRYLPLVGAYERRVHLLTRRVSHWLRLADDDAEWRRVAPRLLARLDRCTTLAEVRQMLKWVQR